MQKRNFVEEMVAVGAARWVLQPVRGCWARYSDTSSIAVR
jgi:hypothetical protein